MTDLLVEKISATIQLEAEKTRQTMAKLAFALSLGIFGVILVLGSIWFKQ